VQTSEFDYDLPAEFIAQTPAAPRDSARLLILDRRTGGLQHRLFRDLPEYLSPSDVLVLNETRVLAARLRGRKLPSGGQAEVLLLNRVQDRNWEALVGGKRLRPGVRVAIDGGPELEVLEDLGGARRLVRFAEPITPALDQIGEMPLPPYIHTPLRLPGDYQTVYSRVLGSAAAPTAGLHFTQTLLDTITALGIPIARITLHVGLDTFAPVTEADPRAHAIHTEWCSLDASAADAINAARARGGRIVAVGTTCVRTLETAALAADGRPVSPFEGPTDVFILPGFTFRAVDTLITNFHLPRSTLLMLVSAFAGKETVLGAYKVAREQGYRFYSFGDAMLIV
jgi:S-adenosylmethionine:tRNA ribosyltransferase-isomerase